MGGYSLQMSSSAKGEQTTNTGGSQAGAGYRNSIVNNFASGGSSLTSAMSAGGFDWKIIAIIGAAALAGVVIWLKN